MSLGALVMTTTGMLTGCLPFGDDDPGPASSPAAEAPPPEPAGTAPSNGAGNGAGQVTKPGTRLKIGQRAVVPFEYASKTGTIGITVTAIEQGDQAAFARRFGSRAQGLTPYFIRFRIENVGGTDLSNSTAPRLGALAGGDRNTGVSVIGEMPGCERGRADSTFTTAGATFEGCRLQASPADRPVTGVEYDESEGGYSNGPIVWSR
ncbi:hypothetical protein [Actinomadura sp. 3N407]|uniref:hypothetical protein n=1 Tax=Actinomadura sp. 3N407 TaxID=3457423 RepID=UPI003FCD9D18